MEAARIFRPLGDGRARYEASAQRREDKKFFNSAKWKRFRLRFLRKPENAICCVCQAKPSTEVDHKKPRRDYPELAFDESNCAGKCKPCHARTGSKSRRMRRA